MPKLVLIIARLGFISACSIIGAMFGTGAVVLFIIAVAGLFYILTK